MARKLIEKPYAGGEWSKARMFSFIRSNLRLMSRKWPPIRQCLEGARRPSQSSNKRLKWEFNCAACGGWFPRTDVQVDHLVECGSLKSYDDLVRFTQTLLCEEDNLFVLCSHCHTNKEEILASKKAGQSV